ncbi:MAG: UDP-N-acetylmuramoyl-L-alanine--D-glutamate ligase [Candidatus Zixiibacteriota bacterium]
MKPELKVKGRQIGIIGMARSGVAAAMLAKRLEGKPFASDSAPETKLIEATSALRKFDIPFETGAHTERLLKSDFIIVSPGVPSDIAIIREAQQKGIPLFSEIEFASWVCRGQICAITGSNGKTTTTTLIGEMINAGGTRAVVCGNIGKPFAEVADSIEANEVAVVEVSSFQLEKIEEFRPEVALILNITPDHLDRHGDFSKYRLTKYRITENQEPEDSLILNQDDSGTNARDIKTKAVKSFFTTTNDNKAKAYVDNGQVMLNNSEGPYRILTTSEILIPGPHNLQNALAAICAAYRFGIEPKAITAVLRNFRGVEHRLEPAGKVAGITFVNDSKATNVDSVCWALRSFNRPICLIAGGRHKGSSYAPIAQFGKGKIKGIVAIGEAREIIFDDLGHQFPVQFADTLENAVQTAFELAIPGDIVLLSPGCASFDMFENFEHRGKVFKKAVASLKNGKEQDETVVG